MSSPILYSPGYGAGWTTWMDSKYIPYAISWPPLVEYLNSNIKMPQHLYDDSFWDTFEPFQSLLLELSSKFNEKAYIYPGGLSQLQVRYVSDPDSVIIKEFDGSERIHGY